MNKSLVIANSRVLNLRVILEQFTNDCLMDDENEKGLKIFDFPDVPSFVAVVTFSLAEPIYIIKVIEKQKATEKMSDNYGHNLMKGELYFRGNYLQLVRSKKMSNKQFKIIEKDVIISPEEVFETFIDVQEDLTMAVDSYLALVGQAK